MKKALLLLMVSLGGALGCGSGTLFPIPALNATAPLSAAPGIRVGTARVDVTPPPGPSTFGHGPDAIATQGYWTRLQCRVFVIEANGARGPNGVPVRERYAIVPCDLPAISYSLFREVAHRVEGVVAGDHILLTATHTHAGPAHYFESGVYSGFLSSRRAGFDTDMLDMLSSRIGRGILDAAKRTEPASLRWVSTHVVGMTRNRSPQSFVMNGTQPIGPGRDPVCAAVSPPPQLLSPSDLALTHQGACANIGVACREIDPMLSTLELSEERSQRPLGSITFFAMHPTVLPAHTRLFGGDVFAVASRALEHDMRAAWAKDHPAEQPDPLAGIVNTNEGDIAPIWSAGDLEEARNIGTSLAAAAWTAHFATATPVAELTTKMAEANMAKAAPFLRLDASRPAELGQGSSHGGSDHATSIEDLVSRLSDWESPGDEQGPKTPLLGVLDRPLAGDEGFPSTMPFSLWHIGDRWIAGVPAELTVTTGFRVRSAIAASTGAKQDNVIIAGLANSYMQYVATCEEFQLQHYEGGSTVYGPRTEAFISTVEGDLACQLAPPGGAACAAMPPGVEAKPFQEFEVAPDADRTHERYPQPQGERPAQLLNLCQLPRKDAEAGPSLCLRWLDSSPGDVPLATRSFSPGPWLGIRLKGHPETLRWDATDPRSFLDDLGDDFQVRARADCGGGAFGWSAIVELKHDEWQAMSAFPAVPGRPRFSLLVPSPNAAATPRLAADFDQSTPLCTRDEILYCTDQYDPANAPIPRACTSPNGK